MKWIIGDLLGVAQARRTVQHLNGASADPRDPWVGISRDVIERFLENDCVPRGIELTTVDACRHDLYRLDEWMLRERYKTLVTASVPELRDYLTELIENSASMRSVFRALWHLRCFYQYVFETGYRIDDPLAEIMGPKNS